MDINLGTYKSNATTVFTGRPQGEQVRNQLNLDKIDKNDEIVIFLIPEDTTSINPSFFLGLLFKSYKKLKGNFFKKYKFNFLTSNSETQIALENNIQDALRNAENSVNINYNDLFN